MTMRAYILVAIAAVGCGKSGGGPGGSDHWKSWPTETLAIIP